MDMSLWIGILTPLLCGFAYIAVKGPKTADFLLSISGIALLAYMTAYYIASISFLEGRMAAFEAVEGIEDLNTSTAAMKAIRDADFEFPSDIFPGYFLVTAFYFAMLICKKIIDMIRDEIGNSD